MKIESKPHSERATLVEVGPGSHDQRLDNFLMKLCKGVPKTHLFRIIRSGEVRINRKRAQVSSRVFQGDVLRIPPIRVSSAQASNSAPSQSQSNLDSARKLLKKMPILFEDAGMLAVSKPAGLAVHGGSGESFGLIEALRLSYPGPSDSLELVHRIDRETSGVLLISKKRSYLRVLQEQLRNRVWKKHYVALVLGSWPSDLKAVDLPLKKVQAGQKEKKVFVSADGDSAKSRFRVQSRYVSDLGEFTLLDVQILTGRTHQIRVHTSASGYPIAQDDRYGQFGANKLLYKQGLKRMFLHASRVTIKHPSTGESFQIEAPLADDLNVFLGTLRSR